MRTKNCLIVLCCIGITSLLYIIFGTTNQSNDSLQNMMSQTHQQLNVFQTNLVTDNRKKLEIDDKYLSLLGFIPIIGSSTVPAINATLKSNFSIVTYVLNSQTASAILLVQNIATKLSGEHLLIYDLGLSEEDAKSLNLFCNNSKCSVITFDLSQYPSYITDEHLHAYRPLIIKDALLRARSILFLENSVRFRGTVRDINEILVQAKSSGLLGWSTRQAVSSRTHPKMFEYFETGPENFWFLPMVSLEFIIFYDNEMINEKILLPWIKCTLTLECIHPIGAQSGGCRFNKKPQYRYSGCHAYDVSALNIVLGLQWKFDETKYSTHKESMVFYEESLEQATKQLEQIRKNISDTSDHPYTDD